MLRSREPSLPSGLTPTLFGIQPSKPEPSRQETMGFEDTNVPCDQERAARRIYLSANNSATVERRIFGWLPLRRSGPVRRC